MPRAPLLEPPLVDDSDVTLSPQQPPVSAHHPVLSILEHVADVHRGFLLRQTEVHRRYLQLQAQLETSVGRGTVRSLGDPASAKSVPPAPPPAGAVTSSSPRFDREQLLVHSRGVISEIFGPRFAAQDGFRRQTRLPEPPLLLVDRVIDLVGEPASMGPGTIRTQTDVQLGGWYLDPCGRMSAGLVAEAGQADLMLMSWLGVDLATGGERVCRLVGCELVFHGHLPRPGDTLDFTIGVDAHRVHNGLMLFSLHYDCTVAGQAVLTMRNGEAGFFTDDELADRRGVLWDPQQETARDDGPVDAPPVRCSLDRFGPAAVLAFAEGRAADCFGDEWRVTWSHVRTPRIGSGRLQLLDEVTEFDPAGGPWGRGYLRATTVIQPDDWFFAGHFHDDPCMPATLMVEAGMQAMAFYLAAAGCTIERDGWRFEPATEESFVLRCQGQVTPLSRQLTYEVFVSGFSAGPRPTLYADVLGTVEGVQTFHVRRLVLSLVPDAPLEHWQALGPPRVQRTGDLVPLRSLGGLVGHTEDGRACEVQGRNFDYRAMLTLAWGAPRDWPAAALGAIEETRRHQRLPGPPYLFISRATRMDASLGEIRSGASVTVEYDVPEEAWFFDSGVRRSLPLAALVEVALQPCGLLAAYVRGLPDGEEENVIRNLDGDFQVAGHVPQGTQTLSTRVELRSDVRFAGSLIQSFDVECTADGVGVMVGRASFGFFPRAALDAQVGVPTTEADRAQVNAPSDVTVELRDRPARYFGGPLRLPGPMLLMLDRITGFWPTGGSAGAGSTARRTRHRPGRLVLQGPFFRRSGATGLPWPGGDEPAPPVLLHRNGARRGRGQRSLRTGHAGTGGLEVPGPGAAHERHGHRRSRDPGGRRRLRVGTGLALG